MLAKYQPNFLSLTPEESAHVASMMAATYPEAEIRARTGAELFEECEGAGFGHADVVMAMSRDADPIGVVCLEKLVGRPLRKPTEVMNPATRERKPAAPRSPAVRKSDPRKIVEVVPNPKKPGSAAHARFALYKVGMTVSEFIAAGGQMADINWDTQRGFIKLEA